MGMRASFLAKTAPGEEGSSGHVHLSGWQDGAHAFHHHALPAITASAADGLRRQASPPEPVTGDAYARDDLEALPSSLESALAAFEADPVLREALGEKFSDYYATSRRWELKAFQNAVTDWERSRY